MTPNNSLTAPNMPKFDIETPNNTLLQYEYRIVKPRINMQQYNNYKNYSLDELQRKIILMKQ